MTCMPGLLLWCDFKELPKLLSVIPNGHQCIFSLDAFTKVYQDCILWINSAVFGNSTAFWDKEF